MNPKKFTTIFIFAMIAVVVIIILSGAKLIYTPGDKNDTSVVRVLIPKGSSFPVITSNLLDKGVIKDRKGFKLAARIVGAPKRIKAGEYELSPSMSPAKIITMLLDGDVIKHMVTIPEGFSISDIAARIEETGLASSSEIIKLAKDKKSAMAYDVAGPTLEGYLFPDTYSFTRPVNAKSIIKTMTMRFNEVYKEEFKDLAADKTLKGQMEIITLASIIEKETGVVAEMAEISSVFHNRLRKGMALQSDPTVIFAVANSSEGFDGNLTRKHLNTDSPYNTYTRRGLPPGPIASPGKNAIKAALNPAETKYLYFVSRGDGTHKFSKTLYEHNKAVKEFQLKHRRR